MTLLLLALLLQDKKVEDALVEFGKAFTGTEEKKLEALEKLKGLKHEKVFAELAKALNGKEPENVRAKAVEILGEFDHPSVAKILADAVKANVESKAVLKAMVKAIQTVNWDNFHAALCDPLLQTMRNPKTSGDQAYGAIAWDYLGFVEKEHPTAAIDGMIKLLQQYEDDRRAGYGVSDWNKKLQTCLKNCTGAEKTSAKDWLAYWKKVKDNSTLQLVYWCPATQKRWDRKSNDAKASCPHHEDKRAASKESPVLALTRYP
jgi:hypothetical protein